MNTAEATRNAIARVINDFKGSPSSYFTEEDVRWRLMKEIEVGLVDCGASKARLRGGNSTSAVHGEYPTPFRCSMDQPRFKLLPPDSSGQRGHFDIVVLNPSAIAECDFKVVRSQDFDASLKMLLGLRVPFVDTVVQIKLLRDLAYPRRTRSIQRAAEYAMQAVDKVAAALDAQPQYYPAAQFAERGFVLLFDNSHLAPDGNVEPIRGQFQRMLLEELKRRSLPDTLSCMWITSQTPWRYTGQRTSKSHEPTTAP